jgi:hypothetical protein
MKNSVVRGAIAVLEGKEAEAQREADNLFNDYGSDEASAWEAQGQALGLSMAIELFTKLLAKEKEEQGAESC